MRQLLLIIAIWIGGIVHAETIQVVSYNVENLFWPERDSIDGKALNDEEWTPNGAQRWGFKRFNNKIDNIARVLTNIGEWSGVDIVGLQEIENAKCVERLCNRLRYKEYHFVHYDSPDPRGIDVALIYKKSKVSIIDSKAINIQGLTTRDILYACAKIDKRDTLHLFVCHMPSQRSGAASEWKRRQTKQVLHNAVDSLLAVYPQAKIVVMGDMNSAPQNDIKGVNNKMMTLQADQQGTYKYQGQWTCLDQFYCSENIDNISSAAVFDAEWIMENDEYLGKKPKRNYNGVRYQNGYSDHLPIVLKIDF